MDTYSFVIYTPNIPILGYRNFIEIFGFMFIVHNILINSGIIVLVCNCFGMETVVQVSTPSYL